MSSATGTDAAGARQAAERFRETYRRVREQVARRVVGQDEVVDSTLIALFAGGHVLLEGVPGLGKTLLVRAMAESLDLAFSRIQFTPDMMPADIQGTQILVETEGGGHELKFQEGPLIANLVLADEINRATPKTQSALLEAMQERQVSVGKRTLRLQEPYCVMATQNPVEQEGTYPLPEAQLDRFLMKVLVGYPKESEYAEILRRTTGTEEAKLEAVCKGSDIVELRDVVRAVPVPEHVETEAVRLVMATQPGSPYAPSSVEAHVALGSSPRGAQALLLAGKVRALLDGRYSVASQDLRQVAPAVLRHRVIVNFQGQSEGVGPDRLIQDVLAQVKPAAGA